MKTWLNKEGLWVSEKPDNYWIGTYDYYTKEKIFSDDIVWFKIYKIWRGPTKASLFDLTGFSNLNKYIITKDKSKVYEN